MGQERSVAKLAAFGSLLTTVPDVAYRCKNRCKYTGAVYGAGLSNVGLSNQLRIVPGRPPRPPGLTHPVRLAGATRHGR